MRLGTHASKGGNHSNNITAEMRSHAANITKDVRGMAASAGELARRQFEPIESYVRDQPVKSVLIAAACGALVMLILGRR